MRIHWAVVIFAVMGTILLTWHFRTQHLDFMTARGVTLAAEDDGSDLALNPISVQPKIEDNPEVAEVLGNPEKPEEPIVAEITELELGDLEASPGLDTYRTFGKENTSDRLFELSSTLRARGQFQRALLAFERIIDTSEADAATLDEAAEGINTLAPTLPRWNIDPTTELSLMLHVGTAKPASDNIKKAVLEVATLIRSSSSDLIEVIPKIRTSGKRDAPENSPLTLWIGTSEKDPVITPVTTFQTSDDEEEAIDQISLAVFQSVRSQLNKIGYPHPPSLEARGKDLITNYTTRLMWQDFAQSLYSPPKEAPEEENNSDPD